MERTQKLSLCLAAALGSMLLLSTAARGTVGSSPVEACTPPASPYTYTVTITLAADGTPIATPYTNKDGACLMGNYAIAFDTSNLPAGATWSAAFPTPTPGGLFQNGCTFGNGAGQNSNCTVVTSPPAATYDYTVTVTINGVSKTLDPRVIIVGSGKKKHHRRHHHKATAPESDPRPSGV